MCRRRARQHWPLVRFRLEGVVRQPPRPRAVAAARRPRAHRQAAPVWMYKAKSPPGPSAKSSPDPSPSWRAMRYRNPTPPAPTVGALPRSPNVSPHAARAAEAEDRPARIDRVPELAFGEQRHVVGVLCGGKPAHREERLHEERRIARGEARVHAEPVTPRPARLPVEEPLDLISLARQVAAERIAVPGTARGNVHSAFGVEQVIARIELQARAEPR